MKNKFLIIILFILCSCTSNSQRGLNFENNCILENSAIIAEIIVKCIEKDSISKMINNNMNITIICSVNSSGTFHKFHKIWNKHNISNDIFDKIENQLVSNNTYFYICYEPDSKSREDIILKEINKKDTINIAISFPGGLLSLYSYENEKAQKHGLHLTKYDYLISMINKYKPQ